MGRIRTVKPELFLHGDLFDLERDTKLPIRVAWMGLFTACDREGRFRWKPRELKAAILPYDSLDFSRVLDALHTRGFVVRYACDGREYGYIPTWSSHQSINNRESESVFPNPFDASCTRDVRGSDASSDATKGKGKEGKGKEQEGNKEDTSRENAPDLSKTGFDLELFTSYLAVRKQHRAPFADDSARDTWIARMRKRYADGWDTTDMLEQMVANGWRGPVDEKWKRRNGGDRQMAQSMDSSSLYE